ncbi:MAG: NUDIX domain-containing protein [bacterium]|nr:NUDIX domain-containing protein [bacterium]
MSVNSEPNIHKLVICANVFVKRGSSLLMLRRSLAKTYLPGYVQPIGGKVHLDEDPLTCVKRELMEEAQIEVKNLRLKAIVTENKSKEDKTYQTNWQIFQFIGEYEGTTVGTTDEGELMWLSVEEIKKEKVADSIASILDLLIDPQKGIIFAKYNYGKNNEIIEKDIQVA